MEFSVRCFVVAFMALLLSAGQLQLTEAQSRCDPVQISWCLQSFVSNMPPSRDCCRRFKSQESCICRERHDSTFGAYLRHPGARRVAAQCGVTYPTYCQVSPKCKVKVFAPQMVMGKLNFQIHNPSSLFHHLVIATFHPMEFSARCLIVALMALLLSAGHLQLTEAQSRCDPVQISWCLQSFVSNMPPSRDCCRRFKSQESCICRERHDSTFGAYLRHPGARRVAAQCGVTYPTCN
ncbi:hypothetical protein CTI12_AA002350 [Artemisia annua]|uniref:Bifunctional inhibitor/plant lipid transfer protein/seed storage helical domain-containing protein n=1 Tax=Artemisia annua TaxID=35608 RepID=A0A2U1QP27_ARTAN|nr:hypothetical protein CTI12_AA002350 [Artemisia annua]